MPAQYSHPPRAPNRLRWEAEWRTRVPSARIGGVRCIRSRWAPPAGTWDGAPDLCNLRNAETAVTYFCSNEFEGIPNTPPVSSQVSSPLSHSFQFTETWSGSRISFSFTRGREPDREKSIPAPPEKFQHNSGFLYGPWASWDDPGHIFF